MSLDMDTIRDSESKACINQMHKNVQVLMLATNQLRNIFLHFLTADWSVINDFKPVLRPDDILFKL